MFKYLSIGPMKGFLEKHTGQLTILIIVLLAILGGFYIFQTQKLNKALTEKIANIGSLKKDLIGIQKELDELKNQDQYKINQALKEEIYNIQKTYSSSLSIYESILDFSGSKQKRGGFEKLFAKSLKLLSEKNYSSASVILVDLDKQIKDENVKLAQEFKIPENVKQVNTPPSSGSQKQKVSTDIGDFLVDIVTADLSSTRVIVDTASDSDCSDNCPTLPLAEYVSRNGAFAGINGSYFCPAEYPSCAGKANSFDTLLMNKNKTYFNSGNNVYSSVPAVIFSGSSARYVGQSLEWGRDTSVDGVIANHPLLVSGGQVAFGGNSDPKQGSKGSRSFVGSTGSTVYIGVVHNATVAEVARVLNKMGIENALNLDSGGSTALWNGGYKVGPGRNLANAILFIRK